VAKSITSSAQTMSTIFSQKATLYFWDLQAGSFTDPMDVTAEIAKHSSNSFKYWLMASTDDGRLLAHEISSAMNHRWSTKTLSLTWNHSGDNGRQNSWCFTFKSGEAINQEQEAREQEAYSACLNAFTQALWETLHQVSWDKIKVCDIDCKEFPPR
jgi:hypothetical protein